MISNMFRNVNMMHKGLDASWLKNNVIANNIANVDTPGFKSSTVSFEETFKAALNQKGIVPKKTRDKHIDFSARSMDARVTTNTSVTYRMDGNSVDIDKENAELAKNTIYYNTLARQLSSEFRKLSMAINEGK